MPKKAGRRKYWKREDKERGKARKTEKDKAIEENDVTRKEHRKRDY